MKRSIDGTQSDKRLLTIGKAVSLLVAAAGLVTIIVVMSAASGSREYEVFPDGRTPLSSMSRIVSPVTQIRAEDLSSSVLGDGNNQDPAGPIEPAPEELTQYASMPHTADVAHAASASLNTGTRDKGASSPASVQAPSTPERPVPAENSKPGAGTPDKNDSNATAPSGGDKGGVVQPSRVWIPPRDEWVTEGHWETTVVHYEALWGERPIIGARCLTCGFTIAGSITPHNEETKHYNYFTGDVIGYETYMIDDAWDDKVDVWVDTSHNVHHEGYWQ
ncbi:MAG: hypothetical protein LBD25_08310 [Coriobacteriales bacterium]|jgi:hypothetical protein|nr:hypothetical protein [Coriobacteriales bacterium]